MQGRTQGGGGVEGTPSLEDFSTHPPPIATNQTKIHYPKTLKHPNKIKLRLNENNNFFL